MFQIIRHPRKPALDLDTVRETISYMRDDASRTPGYQRLTSALDAVLDEIEVSRRTGGGRSSGDLISARFLPFRRGKKSRA